MIKPPQPGNELLRLQELADYNILDTSEELSYDDITLLASSICKTPIALISLIDSQRQWFKSHCGLEARETPRDVSFCGHAILGTEVFEVEDSHKDKRFFDNPLVTSAPDVRFYAGAPLVSPSGMVIGTLCVIDHSPRKLNDEQSKALKALSRQVINLLEMKKMSAQKNQYLADLKEASKQVLLNQQSAIENSKFSSLGIMAAGVAHEINNPLTIILGTIDIMIEDVESFSKDTNQLAAHLKVIADKGWRIQKIVKCLNLFSKESKPFDSNIASVDAILDSALSLCHQRASNHGIEIKIEIEANLKVFAASNNLGQVILNLLNNSIDAISSLKEKWIYVKGTTENENVLIEVMDSGSRISDEIAKKMMIPFFTTKPVGKGTGLGLSISKGVLEKMGGNLKFNSQSEHPTFVIELPKVQISKAKSDQAA